ncbi:MAG: MFS transporter [Clostridia bacterium]|nr:MFS transporter [Clostridia bacterium]
MKRNFDYTWVIVGVCFLMVLVCLGFASSTKSLFPDEIAKDLGTERSLVSIGESCRYIATAIVNLFFGFLVAKFGPRKLIFAGFFSLVAANLLYSFATELWQIYLAGSLLGLGFAWTTTTMVGYVVGRWCPERKGTIMGIILASNGIGGAIAIWLVGRMIDPNVVGTYRNAYRMIAIVIAVTAVIVLIFFRNSPKEESMGNSVQTKKKRGKDWVGIEFSQATRRWYFWGACVCIFCSGLILQGSHGIVAMHFKDVGIDYSAVMGMMSFGSVLLAGAKLMTGILYDKFGLRLAASLCTAFAVISTLMLAMVQGNSLGFALAVGFTVVGQFALPIETIMLPLYASDLFGNHSYAKVLGIFVSVNVAGYAIGAPAFNLCYDLFGSYTPSLLLVAGVMAVILVLLQFVISAAHKEQKKIENLLTEKKENASL